MERRVRRKSHARCEAGEKLEIISNTYLLLYGVCATAIMEAGLRRVGIHASTRLPKRFSEGYGLSKKIIDEIDSGVIITVDNGIAAHDAIKAAKEKGLIVIVTDHHLAPEN